MFQLTISLRKGNIAERVNRTHTYRNLNYLQQLRIFIFLADNQNNYILKIKTIKKNTVMYGGNLVTFFCNEGMCV